MAQIAIIMGSVYGAAEELAETVESILHQTGHTTIFNNPAKVEDLENADVVLVITSTTGQGDLPSNIEPLYDSAIAQKTNIAGKPYGVICLGDSSYETFCGAGNTMEELLESMQAQKLKDSLKIDACETLQPETVALPWLTAWLNALNE